MPNPSGIDGDRESRPFDGGGRSDRAGPVLRAPIAAVCFDWGGTLMRDDGPDDVPMALWPEVTAIPGAAECLAALHGTVPICVATNASASDRAMIERALERVDLQRYISQVFCCNEIGYRKSRREFWCTVRERLGAPLDRIAMVGDSLEHDVLAPRNFGVQTVWFNRLGRRHESPLPAPMVTDLFRFAELVTNAVSASSCGTGKGSTEDDDTDLAG
jgi:phosphoglycolate phosphatase-like HAD superfamily hydrolase